MLGKLIKYDFKFLFKTILPLFVVTPILALFCRLFSKIGDNLSLLNVPIKLIMVLSVLFIIFLPFVTFIIGIIKFYNSMINDEGYLTHTLPVKKSNIILSKIFTSTVTLFLSIIISIACIFIAFNIGNDIIKTIKDIIESVYKEDKLLLFLFPVTMLAGYIVDLMMVYAAMSLGQKHESKKLFAVVYFLALYGINQVVMSIVIYAPALVIPNYIERMEDTTNITGYLDYMLSIVCIVYIVLAVVYFGIINHFMSKKLNLD